MLQSINTEEIMQETMDDEEKEEMSKISEIIENSDILEFFNREMEMYSTSSRVQNVGFQIPRIYHKSSGVRSA